MTSQFNGRYRPTYRKAEYFPTLVLDNNLFELKIIDLPAIGQFPADSEAEWRHFRYYGLRSATAYVLVYDLSSPASFSYIRNIRDQIVATRDNNNIVMVTVGNKADLMADFRSDTVGTSGVL